MDTEKYIKDKAEEIDRFPGAAIDVADDEKVEKEAVKGDVRDLDDNPRNNGKLVQGSTDFPPV